MSMINNLMSLNTYGNMQMNNLKLMSSLQSLSSGYRINSAADDPAGLAVSEKMRGYMTAMERSILNAQDGESLVQTAEGALTEVSSMLNRLTDLAGQASNGILNDSQRQSIQREADDILKEIDRISQATNFNGIKLLDGTLSGDGTGQVGVNGLAVEQTPATAGMYEYAAMPDVSGLSAGDTVSFQMSLNNGTSQSFNFTVSDDLQSMVAADGTAYALGTPAPGAITADVGGGTFASAIADQMQNAAISSDFSASDAGGSLTLTNVAAGTRAPQVSSFSYQVNDGAAQRISADVTAPTDARADIAKDSFTLFNGSNQSDAVFSVNGESFVLVSNADYASVAGKLAGQDVNLIRVSADSAGSLSADDLSTITASINAKTGLAFQANGEAGIQVKAQPNSDGLRLQIGPDASAYNSVNISVGNMSVAGLGLKGLDFTSQEAASRALSRISAARDIVSDTRGDLGATQNRLGYAINSLNVANENITASESRIRDLDMAKGMMSFIRQQILSQAQQAMMGQANAQASQVLQLLR